MNRAKDRPNPIPERKWTRVVGPDFPDMPFPLILLTKPSTKEFRMILRNQREDRRKPVVEELYLVVSEG